MSAPGGREPGIFGDVVGDHGRRDLVHLEAAVSLGNLHSRKTQLPSLLQQVTRYLKFFLLDALDIGKNLIDCKFLRGLPNELMLLSKIFRCKDFGSLALFQKERPTRDLGLWDCSGSHSINPFSYHRGSQRLS